MKVCVLLLALLASSAQAASGSSWWLTQDQEGQRALKEGDPSRAARLFTDPQRRAYAQIKAQQYADAARSLAPLNDAESQYNRGNALARAGDLSSALSAYEAALKHANRPIRPCTVTRSTIAIWCSVSCRHGRGLNRGANPASHPRRIRTIASPQATDPIPLPSWPTLRKSANTQGSTNLKHSEGASRGGSRSPKVLIKIPRASTKANDPHRARPPRKGIKTRSGGRKSPSSRAGTPRHRPPAIATRASGAPPG